MTGIARTAAERVALIADALGLAPARPTPSALFEALGVPDARAAYLVLAVLGGEIPEPEAVVRALRAWRSDGVTGLSHATRRRGSRPVRLASGVTVDVDETARQPFMTGIQRVVRSVLPRWDDAFPLDLVVWTRDHRRLRATTPTERARALGAPLPPREQASSETVVPFGGVYLLPEISVSPSRDARLRTIAEFSGARCVAIGYDCVPITTAETAAPDMPGAFAAYLSALARFDSVAAISRASAAEFEGWRESLRAAGEVGPEVRAVDLPTVAASSGDPALARAELSLGDAPVVLVIGSHEPRKNHLAVLHAAEQAWRAGGSFTLVMVGGRAWEAAEFERVVALRQAEGRPLITISGASDALIDGLYGAARFSVFPSFNEGFGLPVAESIAHGTPVLTSDFGSMRELAEGRGGLLADPRDDRALTAAFLRMVTDDALIARLRSEAAAVAPRTWDEYAAALRAALLG